MKKKFVRQAKLPEGAYTKDLAEVLSPFKKKQLEDRKKRREVRK